jgi:tetratricopeptide (TPR) repeat protein
MEAALASMPGDRELRWLTALAEADAEEWRACLRHVSPLFAEQPAPETGILELRAQLSSHEDFTLTLDKLRQLNLPDPKRSELHVDSAELLASAGKHLESAEEFEQALKISDERAPMLVYNLAVEQYASGQYP